MVLTAIGGDKPGTSNGKIFMSVLALISAGLLVSILAQILRFVSGKSLREIATAIHDRKVRTMPGHIIVCGSSHTLIELLRTLPTANTSGSSCAPPRRHRASCTTA